MRLVDRLARLESVRGRSISSMSDDALDAAIQDVARRILRNPAHDADAVRLARAALDQGSSFRVLQELAP